MIKAEPLMHRSPVKGISAYALETKVQSLAHGTDNGRVASAPKSDGPGYKAQFCNPLVR